MADAPRIFSGIQPTGRKHLGNYIGAIRQYVTSQERGESIFCIVDLHATTVPYDPGELRSSVHDMAAMLFAAGLDPERAIVFRQGDVAEHSELQWLLQASTSWGDLNRMHQWKTKREQLESQPGAFVPAGVFTYPVLQAADVLLYRATEVPVGDDQRQHIELMRDIAERFNERFGETLVVPEHRIPEVGARIMDLQRPEAKMSTTGGSAQGTVAVLDEPGRVLKKFKSAVTDSGTEVRRAPDKPGVSNLIEILAAIREVEPEAVEADFEGQRYGDFKTAVGEEVVEYLRPVREGYEALRGDESELERLLAIGAEKAREIGAPVLADVRDAMGVGPPR